MPGNARNRLYRLLRWSERYAHIDMVYFASGSFWQTVGQVGSAVLSLILVLLFANLLPKETYGLYRYILSLAAILNVFTLTGMNQAVAQAVAVGDEGALRTSVRYQLRWNSLGTLAFWLLAAYYLWHGNAQLGIPLVILGICWPPTQAFNTYSAYLPAKKEFRLNNIFAILSTLIYVLGTGAAIVLNGELLWLVAAYGITTFGASLLFYWLTLRRFDPPASSAPGALRFGRHLTLINVVSTVVGQLDSIILNHFWGPAQLAVYSIAQTIPNRAVPFVKSWVDTGFPKVAARSREEIDRTLYWRVLQGLGVGLVVMIAYVIAAPLAFRYLMPQYLDSVFYSQILAAGFVFAIPNRYYSNLFAAHKLSRAILINSVAQSIFRIALYVALGYWFGIIGIVLAQAICAAIGLLSSAFMWHFWSSRP